MSDDQKPGARKEPPSIAASMNAKLAAQRDELHALRGKLKEAQNERADLHQRLHALADKWEALPEGAQLDPAPELRRAIKGGRKLASKISKARSIGTADAHTASTASPLAVQRNAAPTTAASRRS